MLNLTSVLGILCLVLLTQCTPSNQSKPAKPNVLLICVDDLRPELRSFGAKYISSPNIDKLVQQGFAFQQHFVNAPSCGPSRYTLLTGQYGPAGNNALFLRAAKIASGQRVNPSMPEWFMSHGYTTVSVGKVSHHPGGLGGDDWNDSTLIEMPGAWTKQLMPTGAWQHPRGAMHGLAHGEIRVNAAEMDIFQAVEGDESIYPDGLIADEAINQINSLSANDKPFFLAVGLIKPHLPFGAPKSYYDLYKDVDLPTIKHSQKPQGRSTWHESGEFMQYNRWGKDPNQDSAFADEVRRHYAACVSYADAQIGKILDELKRTGADKNTIVVLWGDHGWHLGEFAIWGKHSLFDESLHAPLVIKYPAALNVGAKTNSMVETLDIFPTLCDLAGIEIPGFTQGKSLQKLMEDPSLPGHPVVAYHHEALTLRSKTHRLILHNDGFVELYDHTVDEKEFQNIAGDNPNLVAKLKQKLLDRIPQNN